MGLDAGRGRPISAAMMDSLPQDYRALVLGASGGIGSAVLAHLHADPRCGEAIGLSRSRDGLDVTHEPSLARLAGQVGAPLHLIFIATGALEIEGMGPEKAFKHIEPEAMAAQFALNATGPALALKHFGDLLTKRERALIGALSARVGSIGDNGFGGWMGYRASKAALNQLLRCAAIELSRTHKQAALAALHPGTVRTPLTEGRRPEKGVLEPQDSAERLLKILGVNNRVQAVLKGMRCGMVQI
jgi:NAD(P)-dependent dehydrogenase (short-subunit alcohol dehydrogenase family)